MFRQLNYEASNTVDLHPLIEERAFDQGLLPISIILDKNSFKYLVP